MSPWPCTLLATTALLACTSATTAGRDPPRDAASDHVANTDPDADRLLDAAADAPDDRRWSPPDWPAVPDTGPCDSSWECGGGGGFCDFNRCVCTGRFCDGRCVSGSDPNHCGACGRVCAAPYLACDGLTCVCPEGTCGPSCAPTVSNNDHCGACDRRCGPRTHCEYTTCVCDDGYGACGASSACDTPLRDNPEHCGGCGARCLSNERCEGLHCVLVACPPGLADCTAPEVPCETNLDRDDAHCGACGAACATGTRCAAGRCVSTAVTQHMPGSMLTATSARPWFRWSLGEAVDGVRLRVCADRACATQELEVDVTGEQYRPPTALREGVHFWQVFARRGTSLSSTPGPTWLFIVAPPGDPARGAPGPLLDVDGDGVEDEVTWTQVPWRLYQIDVRFGAGAGGERRPPLQLVSPMWDRSLPLEVIRGGLAPAGDLDGDGLADAVEVQQFAHRFSETSSVGALRLTLVYGSRVGVPTVGGPGDILGSSIPGPYLARGFPVGNALGRSGFFTLIGNSPFCTASLIRHARAGESLGDRPCDSNTPVFADFDADGRVEFGLTDTSLWCPGAPTVPEFDTTLQARAIDVDLDGCDDLSFTSRSFSGSYVVLGSATGLRSTGCMRMP